MEATKTVDPALYYRDIARWLDLRADEREAQETVNRVSAQLREFIPERLAGHADRLRQAGVDVEPLGTLETGPLPVDVLRTGAARFRRLSEEARR